MKLKAVKRYVMYKRRDGVLEIVDTQFNGDDMFGRDYKVDDDNNLFVGHKSYNKVNTYTHIGEFVNETDTFYGGTEDV